MLKLVENLLEITPTTSLVMHHTPASMHLISSNPSSEIDSNMFVIQGNRQLFVMETVKADDKAKLGML